MAVSLHIPYLPENIPFSIQVIAALLILALALFIYSTITAEQPWPDFPVASLKEEKGLGPKMSWIRQGKATITKGVQTYDGPFQVLTGTGPKIVIPNRFADELKNQPDLNFAGAFAKDFFTNYPGFEAFRQALEDEGFIAETVRVKLTQSLGLITEDLVEETTAAVHDIFGEDQEWHQTFLKENLLHLVARLSSRVFLGKPLCRNKRWLEIAKGYTVNVFISARMLKALPPLIRPFVHWLLPPYIKLRRDCRDAEKLIMPEVEMRKERAQKALEAGLKPPKTADTIGWMYEIARERAEQKNYVAAQLSLTMAAIHTTTEAATQAMLDLCEHPEIIPSLREEVVNVIGAEGWSKQALYKLRLLDSVLKESQRMHPPSAVSMNRLVEKPITLSNGSILPVGSRIMVAGKYNDPAAYVNPEAFDPYRFLREREKPDRLNTWQHVTVSPSHMGFGYGEHACPGRFFASNELKIALAHLVLKYDWKHASAEGNAAAIWEFEANTLTNPKCQVQVRRRKEEISLDLPD